MTWENKGLTDNHSRHNNYPSILQPFSANAVFKNYARQRITVFLATYSQGNNIKGSYNCTCKGGFKGDGRTNCIDEVVLKSTTYHRVQNGTYLSLKIEWIHFTTLEFSISFVNIFVIPRGKSIPQNKLICDCTSSGEPTKVLGTLLPRPLLFHRVHSLLILLPPMKRWQRLIYLNLLSHLKFPSL